MKSRWHLDVLITIALLTLLSAVLCYGAIVERGTSTSDDSGSPVVNTVTFTHDSGTGETDCTIWIGVAVRQSTGMTSVTFNSDALTKVAESAAGAANRCEIWMLENPDTGSHSVVAERIGSTVRMVVGAITLCGVDQATPYRIPTFGFGSTTTSVSHDVTSGNDELVLAVIANEGSTNGVTTGSGQTQQWNNVTSNATATSNVVGVGSTEPGAALVTIQYGQGASEDYNLCAVSIRPSGVVGASDVSEGLQPIIQ